MKLATNTNPAVIKHRATVSPGRSPAARLRMLHFSAVEQLARRLGIEAAMILDLIAIPERTQARRKREGVLKPDEADRLLRVDRVFSEAIRVFGSEEKAARWMKAPGAQFPDSGGQPAPPLSYLDSDAGATAVSEEIIRIDFGDFA